MTGYTVHTGSTVKFSDSWDRIFESASTKENAAGTAKAKAAAKKPAGKSKAKTATKKKPARRKK